MNNYLSKEKKEELKEKLDNLKTVRRIAIAEKLKRAKEHGDLSENFEYIQAKEEQEMLEREIFDLENLIRGAKVIIKSKNKDCVSVGLTVTLRKKDGGKVSYSIVGSEEASPLENKISNLSPMGKSLLGKKVGDSVIIKMPKGGGVEYKIIEIE